jgi:MOSC domain-containing protein YiiM
MKKFLTFITALLFAGGMYAEGLLFEQTYPGAPSQKVSSYSKSFTLTTDGYTLTYTNINNGSSSDSWDAIRAGSKNGASVATITSDLIASKVSKVVIHFTQVNASKTKALYLLVSDSVSFADTLLRVDATIAQGDVTFEVAEPANDLFYQVVMDMDAASANGFNRWDKIQFFTPEGGKLLAPVIMPEEATILDSITVSITAAEDAQIFYTIDESDPTTESTEYVAPFVLTQTTVVKAIAARDSVVSEIATKRFSVLDTISVSEARALIDAKDGASHYVHGLVSGKPFVTTNSFDGKVSFWMKDEQQSRDSVEAYLILDKEGAAWASLEAAQEELHNGDTILVFANKLELYAAKNYYEINGGYYVEKLGAAPEPVPVVYDTINVAEAVAIADSLEANQLSEKKYYVEGYAVNVADYYLPKRNQDFFLVDNVEAPDSVLKAFRAVPTKDGKDYPVLAGDKVRLFGALQKYVKDSVIQLEIDKPTVEFLEEVPGDRSINDSALINADTITVAEALAIGYALDSAGVTEKEYVIAGYVSSIINYYDTVYKNETFWMADEKGSRAASNAAGAFEVYRGKPNTEAEIGLDAFVYVTAKIQNFRGNTIETAGTPVVEVVEQGHEEVIESITVARAVEIGQALSAGGVTDDRYEITGYVSAIVEKYSEQYGNETFWITDSLGSRAKGSAAGAFEVYRGKPNTAAEIGLDAKIKIVCKIKNYNGTIENDGTNIVFEVLEEGLVEKMDTISVAQALEIGYALDSAGVTEKEYVIAGYVSSIINYYDTVYKNETFWMADEKGSRAASNAAGAFEVYRGKPNTEAEIGLDAFVYVTAKIQNFRGNTIETSGAPVVNVVEQGHEEVIEPITVARAVEIGLAMNSGEVTGDRYEITGYVSSIVEKYSEQYKNETFWITDEKGSRVKGSAAGAFEVYRGKPNTEGEIGLDAKIKIVCKIKNYNGTIENDGTNIVFEVLEEGVVETIDTISVAQALEIGYALDSAGVTDKEYVIAGYVSSIINYYDSVYKNETFWMADEKGSRAASNAAGAFEVYRGKPNTEAEIGLDAFVYVTAKIQNFRGNTIETSGTPVVEVVEQGHEEVIEPITVARALEIGLALADQEVTGDRYEITGYVSSISEKYSEQYGNETFWITDEKGSYAGSTNEGAFEVYRGKPNTGAEIGLDAKIKIVCKIKNYRGTIENDGTNIVFEVLEQGADRQMDTITVAQALEIGQALDSAGVSEKEYIIAGYVSNIVNYYDAQYKNETFWMADEKGSRAASNAEGAFEVYRGKPNTEAEIGLEAFVYVRAKIQNFRGTVIETSGTPTVEVVEPGIVETIESITVAQALEIGLALEDQQVTDNRYEITGYVSSIVDKYSEQYGNETFWITDSLGSRASSTAAGAFEVYRGKPNTRAEIGVFAKIRIICKIKNYRGTIENDGSGIEFEVLEPGVIEEVDTISVAEALAIGAALEADAVSDKEYVIAGYVSSIVNYYDSIYKNETFWMTDEKGSRAASNEAGAFEVYRGKPNTEAEIGLEAFVYVTARIQNFRGNVVETSGTPAVEVVEPGIVETIESITVAQAVEIGLALEDQQVTDNRYEITGYVSSIVDKYDPQYGNETFWIVDSLGSRAASAAAGAFEVYRGKPNTGAEIGLFAKIKIVCKIKNYRGTIENDGSGILFEVLEQGIEEVLDTITVARALEIGAALPENGVSETDFVIAGYVSSIVNYYDSIYQNETFWMTDEKGSRAASNAAGAFEVYRGKPTPAGEIGLDAFVYVTAKIQNFRGTTIETSGTPAVEVVEPGIEEIIESITVAQALEIGLALADQQVTDNRYEITGYVSSIDEPFSDYGNETFWITDEKGSRASSTEAGAFEVYRGKPSTADEIGFDAKIKILCKIKNYKGTIENDGMNIMFEVLEPGSELVFDTLTVERAIEKGMALEDNAKTDSLYVIKGYAVKAYAPDSGSVSQTWYMADEPDVRGEFEAYRCTPDSLVRDNDYVFLLGKIQKYVSSKGTVTIEVGYGKAVHADAPKLDTLTIARAMEIGAALADNTMTDERYAVMGYVASIDIEFAEDIQSFSLSDDNEADYGEFKVLNAFIDDPGAELHNKVVVVGRIEKVVVGDASMIRIANGKARIVPNEGFEHIFVTNGETKKILLNGVIYIVLEDKIYNIFGERVR